MRGDRAGGQRGMRGERGQFDPSQFMERRVEGMRDSLNISDDTEWAAIKPLLTDVLEKQFASRMRGMRFGRRSPRGGDRGGDRPSPFGQVDPEIEALQKALDDESTPAQDIEAALKALRAAREKREQELKAAREKLRQVLTIRQEATLVLDGVLD
jgi:hypothetical protein